MYMIKKMLQNIRKQSAFFFLYLVFLFVLGAFLYIYEQKEGHILINKQWSPLQDLIFPYITLIGDGVSAVVVVIALAFYNLRYASMALITFVSTALLTQFLKLVIFTESKRPIIVLWQYFHYDDTSHMALAENLMKKGNSFPSGHTTSAFTIFCFLALLSSKKWIGALLFFLAAIAGASRVYLSQHFVEDVFLGALIGTFGALILYTVMQEKYFKKLENKSLLDYIR